MKKVVIMGASTGIGYAVAEALASRGVKVGVAARHTSSLKALKEKYPDFVEYQNVDVTKHDAKGKLESLVEKLGGMDIYFHVAGIGYENGRWRLSIRMPRGSRGCFAVPTVISVITVRKGR